MAVRCHALQRHIFLLSRPLSSLVKQPVVLEEPFISLMQTVVKVFCMGYAVMIVTQIRVTWLCAYMRKRSNRAGIISIIHQFHAV